MTEKEKKALIDTYALYLRMAAAGAKSPPVALMRPEQAAGVEACIKEAAKMMTPLAFFPPPGPHRGAVRQPDGRDLWLWPPDHLSGIQFRYSKN